MTDDTPTETLAEYRDRIAFDDTVNVSHPVDCYPDTCPIVAFMDDGEIKYQEQAGQLPVVDPETPDWNPRGCSRQCSYTEATYGDERIEQPMRQTGERGAGEWEPISWEEAYEEIADALIDAMEKNPQSIITDFSAQSSTIVNTPFGGLTSHLGGVFLDYDPMVGDTFMGNIMTFGKLFFGSNLDDLFNAELTIIWHANPAYSRNPSYHFLAESRYHGGEIITIAPDHSPSATHADRYVPVEPATDAALCLGIARVLLEEDLVDWEFVSEQTDLPLLVREDTDRFLRESDLESDGSDQVHYMWDQDDGLTKAPRATLDLGDVTPTLEGTFEVDLDGETVEVRPVFDRLRERIDAEYDLGTVQEITGVHPDVIRELAEKIATNRTHIFNSLNTGKMFHGDLQERGMALVLALSGNWGKPGTGMRSWGGFGGSGFSRGLGGSEFFKEAVEETADRPLTDEEISKKAQAAQSKIGNGMTPPAFFWYRHCGYDEVWDEAPLESAGIPRKTSEYWEEAMERGWWDHLDIPEADAEPSVFFAPASNTIRRTRGGARQLLGELWPKLDMVVTIDYRWSTTALYSDIVLPAAFHHEKEQFDSMKAAPMRFLSYCDKAIEPRHDTKQEMEIAADLAVTVRDRAAERGLDTYEVPQGVTVEKINEVLDLANTSVGELEELPEGTAGVERSYADIPAQMLDSFNFDDPPDIESASVGDLLTDEHIEELMGVSVRSMREDGVADGESLEEVKERGFVKWTDAGDETITGLNQAANIEDDEPIVAFTKHVEDKKPFPTLTGRAQFYLDHEWFLEADEHLPTHKSPPADHGGDRDTYPFYITSGHNRHSTHACTLASDVQSNQHRGEPHVFINERAAAERGIEDGDNVRVFNDYGEMVVQAKVAANPAEDQLVIYHAWDYYLFPEGKGFKDVTPGITKPLHLAQGYDHFEYHNADFQPQMFDRHVGVDVEPVGGG